MKKESISFLQFSSVLFLSILFLFSTRADGFYLPDTGQTKCYSNKGTGKSIACPAPGQPLAQDGSYTINPPSYTVNPDGTVFDNNTWLMWQQRDDGIQRTWDESKAYCENLTLAGYDDWRLPAKKELASIVNYGKYSPAIDSTVFQNTKSNNYWTLNVYYGNDTDMWSINFGNGSTSHSLSSNHLYARCVRGGPLVFNDLETYGNGIVTDKETELMWQQHYISGDKLPISWGAALEYCENLDLGGYSDWRLPNVRELESLTDDLRINPSIDKTLFYEIDTSQTFYWTSTPSSFNNDSRWTVSFQDSSTISQNKLEKNIYMRCVRNKQNNRLDLQEILVKPESLDFGYLNTGETQSLTLTVTNKGAGSLVIYNLGYPSAPFLVTADGCSGNHLSVWESCSITVQSTSQTEGIYTDSLILFSNDGDNSNVKVNLRVTVNWRGRSYLLPDTDQRDCFDYGEYYYMGLPIWYTSGCHPPGDVLAQDGSYWINPMNFSIEGNGLIIRDNNTQLMWQREDDGIIKTWKDAKTYCDNLNIGGYTGWRLPSIGELFTIVSQFHYVMDAPTINTWAFPNTKITKYLTDTEVANARHQVWSVDFRLGSVDIEYFSNPAYVRCVRGGHLPYGPLLDNGNDTVTNLATGHMWQKTEGGSRKWIDALAYCEMLTLGGYGDWRLPNVKELWSLLDYSKMSPAVEIGVFPNLQNSYWTSTTIMDTSAIWFVLLYLYEKSNAVSFTDGTISGGNKDSIADVRCVRGDSPGLSAAPKISISPSSIVYGTLETGGSLTQNLTISNTGTGNLLTGTINGPPSPFSITSDGCSGQTLTASATCTVTIKFAPASPGSYSGSISIPSNDADDPNVTVSLSGTAVPSKATLTGTVTNASTGLPLSDVSVSVTDSAFTKTTATGSNGTYTITGLNEGNYTAVFSKAGFITQTVNGTLVAGQTQTLDIQLNPAPALTISITSPLDGAVFNSSPITVTGNVSNDASVTVNGVQATGGGGTFTATIPLNEGQNTITASATDQYNQTASQTINVSLVTKGSITGTVTDSLTGLPIASAMVSITDSLNNNQSALTNNNGIYTISNIPQGDFSGNVTKVFYVTHNFAGTMIPGQTMTINAALDYAPPVISNISVNNITLDSATVSWSTDQPASTLFEYGTTPSYGNNFSDPTLTNGYNVTLNSLMPATTYHFKITSTNINGQSSSSGDQTFTTMSPPSAITLAITSPSDGSTINKPDIMVKGTITNTTGNETGVVVNGAVATIYGNTFVANHIPLTEGQNTITATATDTAGNTATTSINVNAVTTGNHIRLISNIESGIAPLEVLFRVDSTFQMNTPMLYSQGPVPMEVVDCPNYDNCKVRFTAEGKYTITAEAKDAQNITYTDSITIIVLNKDQLDKLLRGKWEGMKGALMNQDVAGALNYFAEESKQHYNDVFAALYSQLPQLVQEMQDIQLITATGNDAKFRIRRNELYGGQILTITYYIYFGIDKNGIWKIILY